jgi:tetratricopeptide (TPR) repeat protein
VSISAILIAIPAMAQDDAWWRVMKAGLSADSTGDYAQALGFYRQAIDISTKLDASDQRRAYSWNALAKTDDLMGNYAGAESGYRRALKEAEQSGGRTSPAYTVALENMATLYAETGQISDAEKLAREALALVSERNPPDELGLALARSCLATIVDLVAKHDEAAALADQSLRVLERYPVAWGQMVATLNTMGTAIFAQGDPVQSERMFLRSLAVAEEHAAADHPLVARVWCNLGVLALKVGHREEGGERLRRAMAIAAKRLGTTHPLYGTLLACYAIYLRQSGDKSHAKAMEAQAGQILKANGSRNGFGSTIDVKALRAK